MSNHASNFPRPPTAPVGSAILEVQWWRGPWLPQLELALDPRRRAAFAFVSHAHSDHTGHHDRTLLTPATARLMTSRFGQGSGTFEVMPFDEERIFSNFSARLLPAGHVLGSAQIFLQSEAGSLLYTGDFKRREGLSSEPARFCQADTLILEATFGLPQYQFPPSSEILAAIRQFCRQTLEDGDTPVLLGYSLGKAQELIAALAGEDLPVMLHPAIWEITRLYAELGCHLPPVEKFDPAAVAGKILICPPSVRRSRLLGTLPRRRVAMISGWALDPQALHRYQCDAAFPLSDHADYPDLLACVEEVQPRRIYVVHGFAREFARDLRRLGWEAWALGQSDQLELSLPHASPPPAPVRSASHQPTFSESGFGRFCQMAETLRQSPGRLEKTRILAAYLRRLPDADLPRAIAWLTGRIFHAAAEKDPAIGPVLLRKALAEAAGLPETTCRNRMRQYPDAGLAAHAILPPPVNPRKWELSETLAFFHQLAQSTGPAARIQLLATQLRCLLPAEACYLLKILAGDLRLGLGEALVADAVADAFQQDPALWPGP